MQALTVKKIGNMPQGLLIFSPELQEGDLIITTPLPNAVDGMKVQLATRQNHKKGSPQSVVVSH
jgi:hypothetical protein